MTGLASLLVGLVGLVVIVGIATLVYRDARRMEMDNPLRWATLVSLTCALGLGIYLLSSRVPIPGLLVIVIIGPVVYLFERDTAKYGDVPADPRVLPNETDSRASSVQESADEE